MQQQAASVRVLVCWFEPKVINPYDTILKRFAGSRASKAIWRFLNLNKPWVLSQFLVWLIAVVLWFLGFSSGDMYVPWTSLTSRTAHLLGSAIMINPMLMFNYERAKHTLTSNFEAVYLLCTCMSFTVGLYSCKKDATIPAVIFMNVCCWTIIFRDSMPMALSNSLTYQIGIFLTVLLLLYCGALLAWSRSSKLLFDDIAVDIDFVGHVSVVQRLVVSPLAVLCLFFSKSVAKKLRYPSQYVIVSAPIRELTFSSMEQASLEIEKMNANGMLFVTNFARERTRNDDANRKKKTGGSGGRKKKRRKSKVRYLKSAFSPVLLDATGTVASRIFGKRAAGLVWRFMKRYAVPLGLVHTLVTILSILLLCGAVRKSWVFFMIPGSCLAWCSCLVMNLAKLRILVRSFLPMYLLSWSLLLLSGFCYAYSSDIRVLVPIVFYAPSMMFAIFCDAQNSAGRKLTYFYITLFIVHNSALVAMFYAQLTTKDIVMTNIQLSGIITSVSSTQALITTPATALLPFSGMFLFKSIFQPSSMVAIRAPIAEVIYTGDECLTFRDANLKLISSSKTKTGKKIVPMNLVPKD